MTGCEGGEGSVGCGDGGGCGGDERAVKNLPTAPTVSRRVQTVKATAPAANAAFATLLAWCSETSLTMS